MLVDERQRLPDSLIVGLVSENCSSSKQQASRPVSDQLKCAKIKGNLGGQGLARWQCSLWNASALAFSNFFA